MSLTFSGQKDPVGGGSLQQNSSAEGDSTTSNAGVSAFQDANNTQVHGGTFNLAGRDVHHTVINNFNAGARPDAGLISKIHDWLAPKVDFRSIQIETLKKRTADTGRWLLEGDEFQRWVKTKGAILWGTGIPGAGKSVVASIVVDHLEKIVNDSEAPHGAISIACAYIRYTERIPVEEILGGLVDQQLDRHPFLVQFVEPLYQRHHNGLTKPTENELVDLLMTFSKLFRMSFYILDGIDEAPQDVQFNLATVLRTIEANFFITSRPLENLESELREAKMFRVVAHADDVILLIGTIIARHAVLRRLLVDPAFKCGAIDKILDKADGMFLHASLQLEALQGCLSVYDIRSTLDEIPARLDGMYAITMVRIEQQSAKYVALAKRILTLVVHAEQPLTVEELQYAVVADLDTHVFDSERIVDEKSLLSVCCGLIYVEKERRTVHLIHFTAKDALQPILLKDYPYPHAFAASTCISRLISCGFHQSDVADLVELDGALDRPGHSFLRHAYNNWYLYARKCDPFSPTSRCIAQFLEQCQAFPLRVTFDMGTSNIIVLGTTLHVASACGILPFLNSIPDLNARTTGHGFTPLALSLALPWRTHISSESALHLLRLPGIDVNAAEPMHGATPLMLASDHGYEDVVDRLLQFSEINMNAVDKDGMTTLVRAVKKGDEGVVKQLLRHHRIKIEIADSKKNMIDVYARLYGLRWRSFKANGWNLFDIVVAHGSFITTILVVSGLRDFTVVQLQKLFLVSIAFKLIQRVNSLNMLFKTAVSSLPVILSLLGLWLILFVFFGILFVEVFGLTKWGDNETRTQNYQSLGSALVMLAFQSTGEGWNQYMHDYDLSYPRCTSAPDSLHSSDCGSTPWSFGLFIAWNLLSMYIFVNMFTGVVVENFSYVFQASGSGAKSITREQMRSFKKLWAQHSNPRTGHLERQNFTKFFGKLSGIFEVRIYPAEYSIPNILSFCRDPLGEQAWSPKVVESIDVHKLERMLDSIPYKEIRQRKAVYARLYHEATISHQPGLGISFTNMLILLAHHKLIVDAEALVLDDLVIRTEVNKLVTDLVNLDRVRSLLRTLTFRRRFLRHLEEKQAAKYDQEIPSIVVDGMPETPPSSSRDLSAEYDSPGSPTPKAQRYHSQDISFSLELAPNSARLQRSNVRRSSAQGRSVSMFSEGASSNRSSMVEEDPDEIMNAMQSSVWGDVMMDAALQEQADRTSF